jgi:hypothetical protein
VGHESLRVCLLSVFMRVERACVYACVRARASVRARACVHGCGWVCARVRARLGEGTTARFVRKPSLEAVYDAVASRCWWPSCVRWKLTSVTFATLHDGLSTSTHECRSAATRRAPSRSMRGEGWLQWRPVECAVLRLLLQQCFEYLRALPAGAHCCEHPSRLCGRGLPRRAHAYAPVLAEGKPQRLLSLLVSPPLGPHRGPAARASGA